MPTTAAGPKESYLNWLEAFDPDIIYSYVDLENTIVERLHEQFYPSFLLRHELYGRTESDVHAYHPKLPIEGLKVTSLIPLATLPTIFNASRNGVFLEAMGHLHNTPFVQDSFGLDTYIMGTRWDANNDTDIDLTIISDGQVRTCEVKQSIRHLSQTVATDYADLMLRLRPDIATLAVMETKTAPLEAIFDEFSQKLKGSGITPELLTLDENNDFDADPPGYGHFIVGMM